MKVSIPRYNACLFLLPEILAELGGKYSFKIDSDFVIITCDYLTIDNAQEICNYINNNCDPDSVDGHKAITVGPYYVKD